MYIIMYARKYYFSYFHYISSFIPLKYIVFFKVLFLFSLKIHFFTFTFSLFSKFILLFVIFCVPLWGERAQSCFIQTIKSN